MHFYPEMISTGMHMTELATALAADGVQMSVICGQPGIEHKEHQEVAPNMAYKGVAIQRVNSVGSHRGSVLSRGVRGLSYTWNTFRTLVARRSEFNGFVVTTNPPFLGIVAALAKKWYRKEYLLIVYDVYPDAPVRLGMLSERSPLVRVWDRVTKFILRHAKVIVVIGVDMAELIKAKLPESHHDRMVLIPNWSDDQHVLPVSRESNTFALEHGIGNRFVVQYSGTMGRTHNVEPIVEAAELLQGENVLFQFIGDGAKKKVLQDLVAAKGLSNVQFLPFQPIEILPLVLSTSDLSVVCLGEEFSGVSVPSKTYGVMAAERPVLALMAADSEIGQTVSRHDCGWVIQYATGEQVADAIREAMADRKALVQKGNNGRSAFLQHYTLRSAAAKYKEALRKL
jgi:glycosyltransferase involved in cell wall biosynthesis